MNEEIIVLLLSQLHKAYPNNQFSFNLKYIVNKKEGNVFQITLHRDRQDQAGAFLFAQGEGADLTEAQTNLRNSVFSMLMKHRDEIRTRLEKETESIQKQAENLWDCAITISMNNKPGAERKLFEGTE